MISDIAIIVVGWIVSCLLIYIWRLRMTITELSGKLAANGDKITALETAAAAVLVADKATIDGLKTQLATAMANAADPAAIQALGDQVDLQGGRIATVTASLTPTPAQ